MLSTSGGQSRVQVDSGRGSLFAPHLQVVRKGQDHKQEAGEISNGRRAGTPPGLNNLVKCSRLAPFLIKEVVEIEQDSRVCHQLVGVFLFCTVEERDERCSDRYRGRVKKRWKVVLFSSMTRKNTAMYRR